MPGEWHTPNATMRNFVETIKKLENLKPRYKVDLEKEITYFNNKRASYDTAAYDLFFAYTKPYPLYDQRKERDNRKFLPDIRENIFRQEKHKAVPALTSFNYGRRPHIDIFQSQTYNRRAHIAGFYRRKRVIWGPEETKYIEDVDTSI